MHPETLNRTIVQFGRTGDTVNDSTGGLQNERSLGHLTFVAGGDGTIEHGVQDPTFRSAKARVRSNSHESGGNHTSVLSFALNNERITPERRAAIVRQARELMRDGGGVELLDVHAADESLAIELVRSGVGIVGYKTHERMGLLLQQAPQSELKKGLPKTGRGANLEMAA